MNRRPISVLGVGSDASRIAGAACVSFASDVNDTGAPAIDASILLDWIPQRFIWCHSNVCEDAYEVTAAWGASELPQTRYAAAL